MKGPASISPIPAYRKLIPFLHIFDYFTRKVRLSLQTLRSYTSLKVLRLKIGQKHLWNPCQEAADDLGTLPGVVDDLMACIEQDIDYNGMGE